MCTFITSGREANVTILVIIVSARRPPMHVVSRIK